LTDVARIVIEAALEAELVEHLRRDRYHPGGQARGSNARNGCRSKTVRTAVGPVEISSPRDRWGTFDPVTVGKWRRDVAGIDRLVLPLAASGVPEEEMVTLLRRVYPASVPEATLARVATTVRAHVEGWQRRPLTPAVSGLQVHRSVLRATGGQVVGSPFVSVVGTLPEASEQPPPRQLLGLYAVPASRTPDSWRGVLRDVRARGVRRVGEVVVADASAAVRDTVADLWPGATVVGPVGVGRPQLAS
jgi:transposase-like protein